jgi:iron complex outermembrane receptor protein
MTALSNMPKGGWPMISRNHPRGTTVRPGHCVPRKDILAVACCLVLMSGIAGAQEAQVQPTTTTQAQAQTEPATGQVTTLQGVQVTGIRSAIANAVEVKNESNSIVEAISAEDIGKLPDISIADSISRLPGLATQRVDGRAQVINIRGMSEQFAGTLLNGREQVSTGDSRGAEFDQYPAELINAVTVYKTPNAALIGQGLSGTVDLQTIRPLDLDERRIVFGASGEYNSLGSTTAGGDKSGYRLSASYVDQFADNTIGVALGVARLDSPFQEDHYKAWWWADTDVWGAPQTGKPAGAVALQGSEGWVKSRNLTRDGLMGVLEFRPSESFHSVLDVYYSKFGQDELMRGAMWTNDPWWTPPGGGDQVSYRNVGTTTVDGVDVVTSGTLDGVQPVVRNDNNTRDDKLFSFGWANTFSWGDWELNTDLNYSKAEREQSTLETYAGRLGPQSIDFELAPDGGFAHYTLPDLSDPGAVYLSDPQGWGHDGRLENSWQEDEIRAARFGLSRALASSFLKSFDVGVNFNRRSKDKRADVYFADLKNGRAPVLVDASRLASPTTLDFVGMGGLLTYDPRALLGDYYDVTISESNDDLRKDYVVDEDVDTFYVKADIDTTIGSSVTLRGDIGVQYIRTDQSSTGFNANNNAVVGSQTLGAKYNDVLPSLNLVADFGGGWIARLGAGKSLMRAPINYLSADSDASVSTVTHTWNGSGGNPTLEPYRAKALDLSFEKYMGDASYVGLALFYKKLETYIYRQNLEWDFTGYDDNGIPPISNIGTFSTWANGKGGYMRGAELSAALSGDLIMPALTHFGALVNVSYTESSIDPDPNDSTAGTDTIPGLSKIVGNATVYYENQGFSVRLSQRYRDSYRGEYGSLFGTRQYRNTLGERQLDMQVSYEFPKASALHGLTVLLQANNLNNSPFRTEVSEATGTGLWMPEEYTEYGRQYLLGFRYNL